MKGLFEIMEKSVVMTEKERYDLLMTKLIGAMKNSDWDTISSLIIPLP